MPAALTPVVATKAAPAVCIALKSTTVLSVALRFMMMCVLSTESVTSEIPTNAAVPIVESMVVHFRLLPVVSVNVARAKSTSVNLRPMSSLVPASPAYPANAFTSAMPKSSTFVATSVVTLVVVLYTLTVRLDFSKPKPPSTITKSAILIVV